MLSKSEKAEYRSHLFRHLDGIVTAPAAYALHQEELCDYLLEKGECTLAQLCEKFSATMAI